MKKSYLVFMVALLFIGIQSAKAEERLRLSGHVKSIHITDKEGVLQVSVKLGMSLRVVGNESVLFWKQTYPHDEVLRNKFLCVSFRIFGMLSSVQAEKLLYVGSPPLPSIQRTKQWREVVADMDKMIPPDSQVQIVKRGETIDFDENLLFIFLKKKAIGSNDPYWGYGADSNVLAGEIKQASNLKLKLAFRVWSPELESRASTSKGEMPFGKKLQKRWKKFGYLWFDDITSEPIPLDLSSAVMNSESR